MSVPGFEGKMIRAGGNVKQPSALHMRVREGLGNDKAVPGIERPAAVHGNVKTKNRCLGISSQQYRALFGDVHGTFGAVNGEGHRVTFFEIAVHGQERAGAAASAGTARSGVPEFLDDARDVFSIEAARSHDRDVAVTIMVRGHEHAAVPEAKNYRAAAVLHRALVFRAHRPAQSGSDEAYGQIPKPSEKPDDQPLPQREPFMRNRGLDAFDEF